MTAEQIHEAFAAFPNHVRRKHIHAALSSLLGELSASSVINLTLAEDFPSPIRVNSKVVLYPRDAVVEAFVRRFASAPSK